MASSDEESLHDESIHTGSSATVVGPSASNWPGVTNKDLFLYALPAVPLLALGYPINYYVAPFFTTDLGVSLNEWAMVILLARIWDIISDPLAGVVCDRFVSPWGRRRHWLVLATPVLMLACVLLFMPHLFMDEVSIGYALLAMCLLATGQTVFGLNHQAWGAELSYDYHERSRIQGWRAVVGGFAPVIVLSFPMFIELTSDAPEMANGDKLFYIAIFILIALPLTTAASVIAVGERPGRIRKSLRKPGIIESWKLLVKNRIMLRLIVIDIFAALPFSIASAVTYFYIAYVLEAPWAMATVLVGIFICILLATPVWVRLSGRFEKHKLLVCAYIAGAAMTPMIVFLGPGDIIEFGLLFCAISAAVLSPGFLLRAMVADVVDSDTVTTGEERTGTFYALVEMTQKMIPAIAVPLVFPYLSWMGFDPKLGLDNSPQAIAAIKYAFVIFPPLPMLCAAYLLYTFPLGREEQEAFRKQIEETDQQ